MLHTIENDQLTCTISSTGAEIRSLKEKETGKEHIWQIDASVWGSSSPVLFPAIGKIKDDKIIYKGQEYAMPRHGIIRHNDQLVFEQHSAFKCSFTLNSSPATLKQYPFEFSFAVMYELVGKSLKMSYVIENQDEVPMHFACGGHTAYACPLTDGKTLKDYVIEFPTSQDLRAQTLGASGLLSNEFRTFELKNATLPLSNHLFDRDALILSNIDFEWVRFRESDKNKGLIVRFEGFPHLALWSKPGADYVCIEPWLGLPDSEDESLDIAQKSSYKTIDPATRFSISIITEIE
ncbi:aldose 1-epimerase family protein [Nonlabens agnitus]|uniref:Aldose epimerase n=1 Tax=Nonlabens agnitus TaxID=870484 RepID=A0A2S9WSU0_9FLAO|nr:aldose 1-epimerase family protein [Nonlabens agnitus]PRP66552.1 hypothetical protein BST86_05285 [Nonlabens agnitus]